MMKIKTTAKDALRFHEHQGESYVSVDDLTNYLMLASEDMASAPFPDKRSEALCLASSETLQSVVYWLRQDL